MQDLLPWITGSGGALVVLALWVWALSTGKVRSGPEFARVLAENDSLKAALAAERTTNNELLKAGGVTNKLIGALVEVTTSRHDGASPRRRDLAAEDLGL